MDKFQLDIKDSKIVAGYDGNSDGEKSLAINVDLKEVLGELISKGEAKVDVKSISFKYELTKIKMFIDTDKDGEPLAELVFDIGEAVDEALKK